MYLKSIDQIEIKNKRVLLRLDCDVPMDDDGKILDESRILTNLPTIKYLHEHGNHLICLAKLGRPDGRDPKLSLRPVVDRLQQLLPEIKFRLVDDFRSLQVDWIPDRSPGRQEKVVILENIRYYPEEEKGDDKFAKELSQLADVYVNDAFAMCHRSDASIVGICKYLPSYAGLALSREISALTNVLKSPEHPLVSIIGGAKISTKINVISKFIEISDVVVVGGGIANTFLAAENINVGKSLFEVSEIENAKNLLQKVKSLNKQIILPVDVVLGNLENINSQHLYKNIDLNFDSEGMQILDIGLQTIEQISNAIGNAKTVIWNGPMGYFENEKFAHGTNAIFDAIISHNNLNSIVGGGDTLAAISKLKGIEKVTHISTGGGAMLEFIEKGTLPGIEALDN